VSGPRQLLSALCACLLKAVRPDDDEDLDDEERGAPLRHPLLRGETGQQVGGGSSVGGLPFSLQPVRRWELHCGSSLPLTQSGRVTWLG
jgi:hypothetical protein